MVQVTATVGDGGWSAAVALGGRPGRRRRDAIDPRHQVENCRRTGPVTYGRRVLLPVTQRFDLRRRSCVISRKYTPRCAPSHSPIPHCQYAQGGAETAILSPVQFRVFARQIQCKYTSKQVVTCTANLTPHPTAGCCHLTSFIPESLPSILAVLTR